MDLINLVPRFDALTQRVEGDVSRFLPLTALKGAGPAAPRPLPNLTDVSVCGPSVSLMTMNNVHPIAFLDPMAVGIVGVICTILIHAFPLSATVRFVGREKKLGRVGVSFWRDTGMLARAVLFALAAHLVEIAFWAALFMICGEFANFDTAYYHSAVNYTSLGYGDIIMSPSWRLLAPLETADGLLLFGVSTAMIFAVIQRLAEARYAILKE